MVDFAEIERRHARLQAKQRALRMASFRCPVIKAANKALDDLGNYKNEGGLVDIELAFDFVSVELKNIEEGSATVELIKRLRGYV